MSIAAASPFHYLVPRLLPFVYFPDTTEHSQPRTATDSALWRAVIILIRTKHVGGVRVSARCTRVHLVDAVSCE